VKRVPKWLQVAKLGKYSDAYGRAFEFTHEVFKQILKNFKEFKYNENKCPINIDHIDKGEAQGYVKELKQEGDFLFAQIDLTEEMFDKVKSQKYNRFSAEVYENFNDKGAFLRGLALLGAGIPAIKDIEVVAFSDGEINTNLIKATSEEFNVFSSNSEQSLESFMNDETASSISDGVKENIQFFAEEKENNLALIKLREMEKKYAEVEKQALEATRIKKMAENNDFLNRAMSEGKIIKRQFEEATNLLATLNDEQTKMFKSVIVKGHPQIFTEITGGSGDDKTKVMIDDFSFSSDPYGGSDQELRNRVHQFMEKNKIPRTEFTRGFEEYTNFVRARG